MSILNYCFPINDSGYLIYPQFPVAQVHAGNRDTVNFVVMKKLKRGDHILRRGQSSEISRRHIRKSSSGWTNVTPIVPINQEFTLQATWYQCLRHQRVLLRARKGKIPSSVLLRPQSIRGLSIQVMDVAPENWWNLNILDREGVCQIYGSCWAGQGCKYVGIARLPIPEC